MGTLSAIPPRQGTRTQRTPRNRTTPPAHNGTYAWLVKRAQCLRLWADCRPAHSDEAAESEGLCFQLARSVDGLTLTEMNRYIVCGALVAVFVGGCSNGHLTVSQYATEVAALVQEFDARLDAEAEAYFSVLAECR